MLFKLKVAVLSLSREMWPRVTLFAVLSVAVALVASFVKDSIPVNDILDMIGLDKIDSSVIDNILSIIASSMLTVTTFSLTTMVTAYGSATTNVSPRATRLLMQDRTTQNVLATFLGSFVFSLVGIIAINIGIYNASGRFILFITTIFVILMILITLIRWINHLTKLGRVGDTTKVMEGVATEALEKRACAPFLGGRPLAEVDPARVQRAVGACCDEYGYVEDVDIEKLEALAKEHDLRVYVCALPGHYIAPDFPLARIEGSAGEEILKAAADAFVINDQRSFDNDPRFCLCVMSEIASRGLPPTVNDPGTAIDVVGRLVRILAEYRPQKEAKVKCENVWVPALDAADLFDDAFGSVMRDSAGIFEVQCRLQKGFAALWRNGDEVIRENALRCSAIALERSDAAMKLDIEKKRLREMAIVNLIAQGCGDL